MKKIIIYYWKERDLIPYSQHGQEFDYSFEKLNEIIQMIIERGLSVMVKPNMGENKDILIIYISKYNFHQS